MNDTECPLFFGKYRGKVENPADLKGLGRIQVSVPDVLGDGKMAWAMPCLPGAGPSVGFYAIPPKDAKVWVEFERGDPDYPIWSGGYWDEGKAPAPPGPTGFMTKVWKGENFSLEILDMPGATKMTLTVKTASGEAKIEAAPAGMTISFGAASVKLAMDGVSINGSNLKVLP
jgi:uncharacterized protein involved in type VI secretion and phage assembly